MRTQRKVLFGFAVALACMAAIAWVAHYSVAAFEENTRWVEHTHQVLTEIEILDSDIADLQSRLRGYAITGDEQQLDAYAELTKSLTRAAAALDVLTADNPEQQRRLEEAGQIIETYLGYTRHVIEARQQQGFEGARAIILSNEGERFRRQSATLLNAMRATEDRLLGERRSRAERSSRLADAVIVGGTVFAVLAIALAALAIRRDLMGRRRAEEALRRSQLELDRFFTLSPDFLTIAGNDGYFKRVSSSVAEILGWTSEEFVTRPYIDLVHPDDRVATLEEVRRQLERGEKVMRFENRYRHKDGTWRVLSWRSVPTSDGLMYGAARDVTEWKRVDDQIRQLNSDLQERARQIELANKELEAFSYTVSHDLRAPLRHIEGYIELLQQELAKGVTDDATTFLQTIARSAAKMNTLIDELLAFSKMGRMAMQQNVLDIGEIVADVRRDLELATRGRNIVWQVGSLPPVRGDRAMIRQVLANLLGNAVKYTRPRDPATIQVGAAGEENGRAIICVKDNGVGFEMKYATKLFGVFQRLHREKDFEGTGIGLANVHRIVTRHGGRIWAEAKPNEGAAFYFTLEKAR